MGPFLSHGTLAARLHLRDKIHKLENRLQNLTRDLEVAQNNHQEAMRQLNATREALLRDKEHIRRKEAEVDRLIAEGVELSKIVATQSEIAKENQRIIDMIDKVNREQEDAQREQKDLLKKFSEEYTEEKKKLADSQDKFNKKQSEMIHLQKTMPAIQSVKKVVNTLKLIVKNVKGHFNNPKKLVEVVGKLQCDLESQLMDVHSYMVEGHVTQDAMMVFADAAVLNTQMVEFLALHGVVDSHAIEVTKESHQEEWQQVMAARRRFYPLTDQQTPEIEYIFTNRLKIANILSTRGLQSSASFAATSDGPAQTIQPSSDAGIAAELGGLTIDTVSSAHSAFGDRDGGPSQKGLVPRVMENELFQSASALLSALEEGLESGRFDKESDATKDQATAAVLDDFLVLHE